MYAVATFALSLTLKLPACVARFHSLLSPVTILCPFVLRTIVA
jgi:hypothetical protein